MELLESMDHCVVTKDHSLHPHQGRVFTNKLITRHKHGPEHKLLGDEALNLNGS